ncbi:MAG: alpha-ketoglutarate-dependent dioxygenase AlkB [Paracoccaceae bacterium]
MKAFQARSGAISAISVRGVKIYKNWLAPPEQRSLRDVLRRIARAAPLFSPETRFGRPMSVQMTSAGKYGWFSDRMGYRYEARHPSGVPWPDIPGQVLDIWRDATGLDREPDCCLINYYRENTRMGLHQDRDEADFSWPVVSISLGDDALFRIGNVTRGGKTESIWLQSGDVAVLAGDARLVYHGIDRIRFGSNSLLQGGGRINLTLRVVD